jgi:hypothetical protein
MREDRIMFRLKDTYCGMLRRVIRQYKDKKQKVTGDPAIREEFSYTLDS